jgi:thiol:disulfide interchange protein DsbC
MRLSRLFAAAALALVGLAGIARAADDADAAIRKTLASVQPDLAVESVSKSPLADLYEVQLKGGRVLYASADGRYLMQGYLYQVKDGSEPVNLTEQAESRGIARVINAIPSQQMVVYPAKGETKGHITVFTDTTCPYCNKLHAEVAELNRQGIEVRYLAFPRQGPGSAGDQQLQAVWCSADRRAAMDRLVQGEKVEAPQCANPVADQFALGQSIGVNGTPAIVLANGQLIPGYQAAPALVKEALSANP